MASGPVRQPQERNWFKWGLPRTVFLVGTVVLVYRSTHALSQSALNWTLALYALCSLVFIWRQFRYGHTGARTGGQPWWLIVFFGVIPLVVGAALLIVWYVAFKRDDLLFIGAVLVVLGLGWLVEAVREMGRERDSALFRWGGALLLLSVSLTIVGIVLLRYDVASYAGPALLAIGLLGALPVGLNILSEVALRRCGTSGRTKKILGAGLAGLAVVVAFVLWLWYRDMTLATVLVAGTVALLFFLVSKTHGDVAIVVAVFCVLAAAPPEQPVPQALTTAAGPRVLVAMGDSYMSGEGAQGYFAGTNQAGGDECRRAPTAYAVRVVTEQHRFDRLLFLACSGARTFNLLPTAPGATADVQSGEGGTQIDLLKRQPPGFRPALVLVAVGGNDAGFSLLGQTCIAPGDCTTQRALFESNLTHVQQAVEQTYRSLKAAVPAGVPIVAVPYPQPLAQSARCGGVALSRSERDFARTFVDELDAHIEAAARNQGVYYLAAMKDALATAHLQLCQTRNSEAGLNFIGVESVDGLATQRFNPIRWLHNSLHPNERGHLAMLAVLDTWLDQRTALLDGQTAGQASPAPAALPSGAVQAEPQCSMTSSGPSSCQGRLSAWELRQVVSLWPWLFPVLLVLALIWAACIAVISGISGGRNNRKS